MMQQRAPTRFVVERAVQESMPEEAVVRALRAQPVRGKVMVLTWGKWAWRMAVAAQEQLGIRAFCGTAVTWRHHGEPAMQRFALCQPDKGRSLRYDWSEVVAQLSVLRAEDSVLLLCSRDMGALWAAAGTEALLRAIQQCQASQHLWVFANALTVEKDVTLARMLVSPRSKLLLFASTRMLCHAPSHVGYCSVVLTTLWFCKPSSLQRIPDADKARRDQDWQMVSDGWTLAGNGTLVRPAALTQGRPAQRGRFDVEIALASDPLERLPPRQDAETLQVEIRTVAQDASVLRVVPPFLIAEQPGGEARLILVLSR